MGGESESHYTRERVRADEAVRGAGRNRPAQRRGARRGQGPGRARCADRPSQSRVVPARVWQRLSTPPNPALRGPDDGSGPLQGLQRPIGHPAGDELLATWRERSSRHPAAGPGVPLRRRRVCRDPPRRGARGADEVARRIRAAVASNPDDERRPARHDQRGDRLLPRRWARQGEARRVRGPGAVPCQGRPASVNSRDPFVAALDETAMGLLDGLGPEELLDSILNLPLACSACGPATSTSASPASVHITVRAGIGLIDRLHRLPDADRQGIGGPVFRTGPPLVVDDYDASPVARRPSRASFGAGVGVPLTSADASSACSASPRPAERTVSGTARGRRTEVRAARIDRARERAGSRSRRSRRATP